VQDNGLWNQAISLGPKAQLPLLIASAAEDSQVVGQEESVGPATIHIDNHRTSRHCDHSRAGDGFTSADTKLAFAVLAEGKGATIAVKVDGVIGSRGDVARTLRHSAERTQSPVQLRELDAELPLSASSTSPDAAVLREDEGVVRTTGGLNCA